MNIELPLEKMTWGQLRKFVALGAKESVDAEVTLVLDDDYQCIGLALYGIDVELAR